MGLLRRSARTRPTRLFFAADIHGSDAHVRKFLGAAKAYDADALVFGGDIMGKALVPIVRENGHYRAHFAGVDHAFERDGLAAFTRSVEVPGFYWQVMDREEYERADRRSAGDPGFVPGAGGRAARGVDRTGRGAAARQRRAPVPDRRQRRRPRGARGARPGSGRRRRLGARARSSTWTASTR